MENVSNFSLETIQTHQSELENVLQDLIVKMENDKQKVNALHGAITTCKFFVNKAEEDQKASSAYPDQMELPY
jgi:hypothetical protein|tara:strand:+ start:4701 stop:4919 length:219 start_codon:yes stop_codon:yes gene_type:complete